MLRRATLTITGMTMVLLAAAGAASAQSTTAGVSVTAGYQLVHIPDETFPLGFNVDVAAPAGGGWAGVGELGVAHDNRNDPGATTSINVSNFGGGIRWNGAGASGARAFVQLIAGGVHTSANIQSGAATVGASDTAFMLQPGIGVAVPAAGPASVVVQGDYRRVFFKEGAESEFRLVVGVRITAR